ncbi:phosphatidylethanolamine-binding protein [Coniella lustricola]|uniref:Phosphatidylethanolamine-binding protein n=1 Tax=Coniella lustricola TaxID=2025994 RepID=A0A2T3AC72_9PEZI|nr:phosphatidylethanolamine-binding protein [Coniella lustricola]
MLYTSLVTLAAASIASALTPTGFQPGSSSQLVVAYNGEPALNGAVEAKASVQTAPSVATQQRLNGTSYAVLMMDIDIPTNAPPAVSTLLHWMQTGLTPASTATSLNATKGAQSVYLLQNTANTAAFATYLGPSPPAKIPLSHMYVQILVDTSNAKQDAITSLQTAAANRTAFSALDVLTAAGLQNSVVAGNYFNVTNPGPATD